MTRSARKALRWLCDNQLLFDFHRRPHPVAQLQLLKPFSELVLAISVLGRLTRPLPRCARRTLRSCWARTSGGHEIYRVLLARPDLVEIVGLIASFARSGYSSASVHRALPLLMRELGGWGADLPMWRRMAIWHALDVLGLQRFPARLPRGSLLRDLPAPWTIAEGLAYAATHEIFYVTDFGLEVARVPPRTRDYLAFCVPLWLEVFTEQRHWDLVAELLLCGACLRLFTPAVFVTILEEQQDADGSFLGPKGAARDVPARGALEQYFRKRYHTTVVAMLALTAQQQHAANGVVRLR